MSFDTFMRHAQTLNSSMEALAALGAELTLRQSGSVDNSETRQQIVDTAQLASQGTIDTLTPEQRAVALNFIRAFFRQATDLLERPERAPGWVYDDPAILQAQGRASRMVVHFIAAAAAEYPPLASILAAPAKFLDIGTGTAWLAIAAAETWPQISVTGVDIWRPALALAHENVAAAGLTDRIRLLELSIAELDEAEAYSLVWLPGPFIPLEIIPAAIGKISAALKPGGILVFGTYSAPPSELAEALARLRIHRGGGHPWRERDIADLLLTSGFTQPHHISTSSPIAFTIAQKLPAE